MLERKAHIATIVGSLGTVICVLFTGASTWLSWRMYQIATHTQSPLQGGGASMTTPHVPWLLPTCFGIISTIAIGMNVLAWRMWARIVKRGKREQKLVIDDATYGAIEGGGVDYDVTECLQKMALQNGLAFEILNHNFIANGINFVPDDPKAYKKKRLKLTYSYAGGPTHTIRRCEETFLVLPEDPYIEGFPLLRLEVINAWSKLGRFFKDQKKRVLDEQVSDAGRAGALLYSATPDPYLAAEYERSLKSEMVDLHQCLMIYGIRDNQLKQLVCGLRQPVYGANCRDAIETMMEILWQIAPKIAEEDDEKTRIPGRAGSPEAI